MAIIEAVSDPILLQNLTTSQGQAIQWLINEDKANRCPDNPKLIQRWAMATFYFSTGGEQWFRCSHNTSATDPCGTNPPFAGDDRFLSEGNECLWAGIKCSVDGCVTEIEFGTCLDDFGVWLVVCKSNVPPSKTNTLALPLDRI